MKAGDMDGDGSDEIVVLSASNATTGNGTAFAVLDYNLTTRQLVMSNWTGTCDDSEFPNLAISTTTADKTCSRWGELEVDACLHLSTPRRSIPAVLWRTFTGTRRSTSPWTIG
ncbi:MAG: hypothetical protein CM15mP79_1240 [Methanobacteriota archaeon]|nr:MAG: hypothetical protein CM15mP79_1240 [Euryarchaeota archaeon]